MKTLRLASLLLFLLTLTAYTLPAPAPLAVPSPPTTHDELSRETLLRYRYLRDTELPQLLAWLHERGPFTRPMPGLLPATTEAVAVTAQ